jgi:hypothetical protein
VVLLELSVVESTESIRLELATFDVEADASDNWTCEIFRQICYQPGDERLESWRRRLSSYRGRTAIVEAWYERELVLVPRVQIPLISKAVVS